MKFLSIIDGDSGYLQLCGVGDYLRGSLVNAAPHMAPEDMVLMRFAPTVSCEVERTFSCYKAILRDNRQSFLFKNLKIYVVAARNQ